MTTRKTFEVVAASFGLAALLGAGLGACGAPPRPSPEPEAAPAALDDSRAQSSPHATSPAAAAEPRTTAGSKAGTAPTTKPELATKPDTAANARTADTRSGDTTGEKNLRDLLAGLGVRYLPEERRVEVSGWVDLQSGLVEVFACAPEGKTHEAVVVLDCVPSGLHAALLALGLEPGTPVELGTGGEYKPPTGDRVEIRLRWKASDGTEKEARAEDWVWDHKRNGPMQPGAWIFAGSFMQPTSAGPAGSTYAANYVKSLVTTYHDASSILENPWSDGVDDTVYYSNDRAVPPVGTPVTAIFLRGK